MSENNRQFSRNRAALMKRFRFGLLPVLAGLWLWISAPTMFYGQDTTAKDAPKPADEGQVLNNDTLMKFLENMGLEPKKLSKGYLIAIKQDTWTLNTQFVLSEDATKIGLNANLGVVDESTVSASQWMNLLVANADIDPSYFYYDKEKKKLFLHRSFDNRKITPAILRRELDRFCSNIRSTSELWKFTK